MVIICYIGMVVLGAVCIGCTIHTIKHQKEKDYDAQAFNDNLKIEKAWLEKEIKDLNEQKQKIIKEIEFLYEQQDELTVDQQIFHDVINDLKNQKTELEKEVEGLNARIETMRSAMDETSRSLETASRKAFESFCDALEFAYKEKEQEFDNDMITLDELYYFRLEELKKKEQELLKEQHEDLERLANLYYLQQETMLQKYEEKKDLACAELSLIRQELDKIRSTRAAAMEAQLREEEIKNKATFYTLQVNEADRTDIAYLQGIEHNLREARPLRMLIWSTFYRDRLNDLAARVGASGACGIYKITHIGSGISYIGQAKDIKERWTKEIKEALGIDAPVTNQRCSFMREKGVDNFTFEILEKCSATELNEKEKFYIDLYQTYEFGLNGNKGTSK